MIKILAATITLLGLQVSADCNIKPIKELLDKRSSDIKAKMLKDLKTNLEKFQKDAKSDLEAFTSKWIVSSEEFTEASELTVSDLSPADRQMVKSLVYNNIYSSQQESQAFYKESEGLYAAYQVAAYRMNISSQYISDSVDACRKYQQTTKNDLISYYRDLTK